MLTKIDEILAWERASDQERDSRFVDLGRYLCEVRAGQYWRLDNLRSFDEFLERKFPESRRKAYYLMAIHEHLPRIHKAELRSDGLEPRPQNSPRSRSGTVRGSIVHPGCTKRRSCRRRSSNGRWRAPDGEGNGGLGDSLFQGLQEPAAGDREGAGDGGLMLGNDKSRGYCLEMICADFLAGVSLETGNQDTLLSSLTRLVLGLPVPQREQLLANVQVAP